MAKLTQKLFDSIPEGLVVTRQKLLEMGFDKPAMDYFLRSGKLTSINRGVYRRPGPPLKWEHLLYSVNQLGFRAHVGSRSALNLSGFAHYLPLGEIKQIDIYCNKKLPNWLTALTKPIQFVPHRFNLLSDIPDTALTEHAFGHWDWKIRFASAELALLELVDDVVDEADFLMADKYFETATTLRPRVLNNLLSRCNKIQANRLFLWFAKRHNLQWVDSLNVSEINLGKGKRMIIKGGTLDKKFKITVPKRMVNGFQSDFF